MAPQRRPEGPFGHALAAALASKGWPDDRLAGEVGVSKQSISKYVRGAATPSVEIVHRIEQALGVGLAHHLGYVSILGPDRAWHYDAKIAELPEHIRQAIDVIIAGEERARRAGEGTTRRRRGGRAAATGPVTMTDVEAVIAADPGLDDEQRSMLLALYRSELDRARGARGR